MPAFDIYEINTATWLHNLRQQLKRPITLADVPAEEWDRVASYGCQAVWLMGVWERSPAAVKINRQDHTFIEQMRDVLPDFDFDQDVIGSAYSIKNYVVEPSFGGETALAKARNELNKRGIKLILDYVPNHLALDHPWATEHAEYFVQGTSTDLEQDPRSYVQIGEHVLARGRDPQFEAWIDVLQLNVFEPSLRQAVRDLLQTISRQCDGVRCDMAMLLLNDIFSQTWRQHVEVPPAKEFWDEIIKGVKSDRPDFVFMAEAYWGSQEQLVELGFDYCYDKNFYDYLRDDHPVKLKDHIKFSLNFQLVRFLENHDEPRAAATFDWPRYQAAAVLLTAMPGPIIYYEGQFQGLKVRTPVQLGRDPEQPVDQEMAAFYSELLKASQDYRQQMEDWQYLDTKAYKLNKRPAPSVITAAWRANGKNYICIANWSHDEVKVQPEGQFSHPELKLWTNQRQPIIQNHQGQLGCQLAAWQTLIINY